ncbi:MAG: acetate--CoA ligase family protein [Nitrososphaeria archaeon]|nr:acetate--CoA ligase family protein [Nitrososphaeria archaeon]
MNDNRIVEQIKSFFEPSSVAVVGASKHVDKAGHVIFKNFVENKRLGLFKGDLYPINPREESILGYKCFPSIKSLPVNEIELVVIVVPAAFVPQVMQDAKEKCSKAAIIISSGFSEVGNRELENEVRRIAFEGNIRVLGPNCLGVYDPVSGVDTLFLPITKTLISGEEVIATPRPKEGKIAIVTQSGAFGVAALDYLAGRQLGISKFVSFGNRIDLDESDLLNYFLHDKRTEVILMYIESVRSGNKFIETAKNVTRIKPVIALKTGKTKAGAKAALSHTASIAGLDEVYNAAFFQAGIIRAQNMNEFFNMGKALSMQPPARGKNICIITDAGGPGIMVADECELKGLKIESISEDGLRKLEVLRESGQIPKFASLSNPIDLTGSVTSDMIAKVTEIVYHDKKVDGIVLLGLHHVPGLQEDYVDRIALITSSREKPIIACDIGETEMALYVRSKFEKFGIPAYASPEDAACAMYALCYYGEYLNNLNRCK